MFAYPVKYKYLIYEEVKYMKRMSSLAYHFGVKLRFYPSSKQKKIIKLNYDAQRFVYNSYVGRNRTSYHAKRYLANRQNRAMPNRRAKIFRGYADIGYKATKKL